MARGIIFPHLQISRKTESRNLSVNVDESVVVSQSHVLTVLYMYLLLLLALRRPQRIFYR